MYAYQIRKRLGERFGFTPALVTSYVVLYRLEKEGYVEAEPRDNRKYYRITSRGENLLQEGIRYLHRVVEKLA